MRIPQNTTLKIMVDQNASFSKRIQLTNLAEN